MLELPMTPPLLLLLRVAVVWLACALGGCRANDPVEETEVATIGGAGDASASQSPAQDQPTKGPLARRKVTGSDPLYPEMSKRLQEEGAVELAVEVGKDGSLRMVRVTKSSGYERLDQAAVAAVRQWTFTPRTGEEAALVYHQRFVFRLVSEGR